VGDTIVVHYVGTLADGTVFDESWSRGEPFQVTLGEGTVIAGWEEGLLGAEVGERRRLVLGADNAYGDQANGEIPANAPLAFEVDVVDLYR
jgi:FKBP-type peptidyl-prolyl cis-trans isomerase